MDWLKAILEADPQYQKEKEERIKAAKEFHEKYPHMQDLLIQSDEGTSFTCSDDEE